MNKQFNLAILSIALFLSVFILTQFTQDHGQLPAWVVWTNLTLTSLGIASLLLAVAFAFKGKGRNND